MMVFINAFLLFGVLFALCLYTGAGAFDEEVKGWWRFRCLLIAVLTWPYFLKRWLAND